MSCYIGFFKKYAVFEGRARLKEYWMFILLHSIVLIVLSNIDNLIFPPDQFPFVLSGLYGLAALLPTRAVSVRRLHDIGWSGWGILLGFIPYIGACLSSAGDVKYRSYFSA